MNQEMDMNQEIGRLADKLRLIREERTGEALRPEEFPAGYAELIEEINRLAGIGKEQVHQEQAKMRMIHQVIASGMWSMNFDGDGNMTQVIWSPEFRKMLGFTDENDFPNRLESWSDRLHPDDREETMRAYWKTVREAGKYDVKYRLLTKAGEYRWYHAIGETLRLENGTPRLFMGVFIDITRKKEKERLIGEKLGMQEDLKRMKQKLEVQNEILNALC